MDVILSKFISETEKSKRKKVKKKTERKKERKKKSRFANQNILKYF